MIMIIMIIMIIIIIINIIYNITTYYFPLSVLLLNVIFTLDFQTQNCFHTLNYCYHV